MGKKSKRNSTQDDYVIDQYTPPMEWEVISECKFGKYDVLVKMEKWDLLFKNVAIKKSFTYRYWHGKPIKLHPSDIVNIIVSTVDSKQGFIISLINNKNGKTDSTVGKEA